MPRALLARACYCAGPGPPSPRARACPQAIPSSAKPARPLVVVADDAGLPLPRCERFFELPLADEFVLDVTPLASEADYVASLSRNAKKNHRVRRRWCARAACLRRAAAPIELAPQAW